MSNEQLCVELEAWLGQVGRVGLELPSGWIGKPGDEVHDLISAEWTADRIRLEFDVNQFIFDGQSTWESGPQEFSISTFRKATLTWRGPVDGQLRERKFDSGTVRLHGTWSLRRTE